MAGTQTASDKMGYSFYDFSNTIAPRDGDQVQQRVVLDLQDGTSHAGQLARLCAGEDAEVELGYYDRAPLLFGRPRRKSFARRARDGVFVRRRRILLLHEHRV